MSHISYPALDRQSHSFVERWRYLSHTVVAWYKTLLLVFTPKPFVVHFNYGQTLWSLLRMGIPHSILRVVRPGGQYVVSLHGHVITHWSKSEIHARILRHIISYSEKVTVNGWTQVKHLEALGIPARKVQVMPNTCTLKPITVPECETKHTALNSRHGDGKPIRLLHLSTLIESKGFPEFLLAVKQLVAERRVARPIHAVLCGPLSFTPYSTRLSTPQERRRWIRDTISDINRFPSVRAEWIPGAVGKKKAALFRSSHIFVFPSQYPVESQPIVLLEAMASGSCIVTTEVGEIGTAITPETGILLDSVEPQDISNSIHDLITDDSRRMRFALNALDRYNDLFSKEKHNKRWKQLLISL